MPDLGGLPDILIDPPAAVAGVPVSIDPPVGPVFEVGAPVAAPDMLVVPVEGPTGPVGPQGAVDEAMVGGYVDAWLVDNPPVVPEPAIERSWATAADTWDWTHNLGFTPAVTVMTPDRQVVHAAVTLNTATRTVVSFWVPVAGILALS